MAADSNVQGDTVLFSNCSNGEVSGGKSAAPVRMWCSRLVAPFLVAVGIMVFAVGCGDQDPVEAVALDTDTLPGSSVLTFSIYNTLFRVFVDVTIGGKVLPVMLDAGSGTFATCPCVADTIISNSQAPAQPLAGCEMYGLVGGHGWKGNGREINGSDIKVGKYNTTEKFIRVANMTGILDLKKDECHAPGDHSIGAVWPVGIMGIGPRGSNIAWSYGSLDAPANMSEPCPNSLVLPTNFNFKTWGKQLPVQIQHFFGGTNVWGITWSGKLGPETGKLYMGEDAAQAMSNMPGTTVSIVPSGAYGPLTECKGQSMVAAVGCYTKYSFHVTNFTVRDDTRVWANVSFGTESIEKDPFVQDMSTEYRASAYFDSGSSEMYFPQQICDGLKSAYADSDTEPESVRLEVGTGDGLISMPFPKNLVDLIEGPAFSCDSNWDGPTVKNGQPQYPSYMFGLHLMRWFDIFINLDTPTMKFVSKKPVLSTQFST